MDGFVHFIASPFVFQFLKMFCSFQGFAAATLRLHVKLVSITNQLDPQQPRSLGNFDDRWSGRGTFLTGHFFVKNNNLLEQIKRRILLSVDPEDGKAVLEFRCWWRCVVIRPVDPGESGAGSIPHQWPGNRLSVRSYRTSAGERLQHNPRHR